MQPTKEFLKSIHLQELQEFLQTPSSSNLFRAFPWKSSPQGHDYWDRVYTAASLSGIVHADDWEIVNDFKLAIEAMQRQEHRMRVTRKIVGKHIELHNYQGLFASFVTSELGMSAMNATMGLLVKAGYSVWQDAECIAGELGDMLSSDNMA